MMARRVEDICPNKTDTSALTCKKMYKKRHRFDDQSVPGVFGVPFFLFFPFLEFVIRFQD